MYLIIEDIRGMTTDRADYLRMCIKTSQGMCQKEKSGMCMTEHGGFQILAD